jgi:hypothetical protein
MAKTNYQTIDAYHQAFSGETLARMQTTFRPVYGPSRGLSFTCDSVFLAPMGYFSIFDR